MKKSVAAVLLIGALSALAALWVLCAGYSASEEAAAMMPGETAGGAAVFMPEDVCGGLIFYPGGLVDHRAYAPLMEALRERGILCLLAEMPLDLAVLDVDAADGLAALYPEVETWIIGGHSLGGAMAASYAAKHAEAFDALLLLGAYSAEDLSATDLRVLSIYGTEDGVLNREAYQNSLAYYPAGFTERILDGGCHAYFGDYGAQKGDGVPKITREEQIDKTAEAVLTLLRE